MVLLFIVNTPEFFLSHRLPVAMAARAVGYEVHVGTGPGSDSKKIIELGFTHYQLPLSRSRLNPLAELLSLWAMVRLIRSVRPKIVHLVTIKPAIYGGIACRLLGVPAVVVAISGLGTVFLNLNKNRSILRLIVKALYRVSLGHSNIKVIFQNPDDRSALIDIGAVKIEQATLIKGSGVDLSKYQFQPEPVGIPVVVFAGRLLRDKGVEEFINAARILKGRGVNARFWLVGSPDFGNLSSVSANDVMQWTQDQVVEVLGYRLDIPDLFANSNIVVLPSYREGLPKVLIEAAACGRAVVTTNVPGCRDAIESGKTGLLVDVRDVYSLADAVQTLIEQPSLRMKMGILGRALAERDFAIERVIESHMVIYEEMLNSMKNRY